MIEKRFTQKDEDDWEIFDNGKHLAYAHSGYNAEKLIEMLNSLSDENKQLKSELVRTKVLLSSVEKKYSGLLKLVHGFDGDDVE